MGKHGIHTEPRALIDSSNKNSTRRIKNDQAFLSRNSWTNHWTVIEMITDRIHRIFRLFSHVMIARLSHRCSRGILQKTRFRAEFYGRRRNRERLCVCGTSMGDYEILSFHVLAVDEKRRKKSFLQRDNQNPAIIYSSFDQVLLQEKKKTISFSFVLIKFWE